MVSIEYLLSEINRLDGKVKDTAYINGWLLFLVLLLLVAVGVLSWFVYHMYKDWSVLQEYANLLEQFVPR